MGWTQPQALPDADLDRLAAEFAIDRSAVSTEAENARGFDTTEHHIDHVIAVYRVMDKKSATSFVEALHEALRRARDATR
jgi:hypothetical protein